MENAVCPFCNSKKISSLKTYCSVVSDENTRHLINNIQPTFRYGIHVSLAGIAMIIAAFAMGNSHAYLNTFYEYNAFWKMYDYGTGMSFPGVLGLVTIAGIGIAITAWGSIKHAEDTTLRHTREQNKRFYDEAIVCQDCRKAWVPGFEDKSRIF